MNITHQIECAKRELAMRRGVYPKWIGLGRMSKDNAEHELQAMQAIVTTLEGVRRQSETAQKELFGE